MVLASPVATFFIGGRGFGSSFPVFGKARRAALRPIK
jgi:hypothetical protein